MKKVLFLLLLTFTTIAQVVVKPDKSQIIKGFGALTPTLDKVTLRRYQDSIPSNYTYSALFRKISDKKAAVGISFRNEQVSGSNKLDGRIAAIHILLQNDSLKILFRNANNTASATIFSKSNIPIPAYLKAEVDNLGLKLYHTKNLQGKNLKLIYQNDNIFQGWTTRRPNIINPVARVVQTGEVYNISLIKKNLTDTTVPTNLCNCNNTPTFKLEYARQRSSTTIIDMSFNSCNAYSLKYDVLNSGGTVLKTGTIVPTSGYISADVTGLSTGTYSMRLTAQSCVGTDILSFSYTAPTTTPTPPDNTIPAAGTSYTNVFASIPRTTQNDTFDVTVFPNIEIPTETDTYLGIQRPTFFVSAELPWEYYSMVDYQKKGIYTFARQPSNFVSCVDKWPNTAWEPTCPGQSYETFVSAQPHSKRGYMGFPWPAGNTEQTINYYATQPLSNIYNGSRGSTANFGLGDAVNGRAKVFCGAIDVELGYEDGGTTHKANVLRALSKGYADAILGYAQMVYVAPFFTFGYDSKGRYPNPDGSYTLPVHTQYGVTQPINGLFSTTGPSGSHDSWNITNTRNVIGVEEITSFEEDTYEEDFEMKNTEGVTTHIAKHFGIDYDQTGATGWNVTHTVAKTIHFAETNAALGEYIGLQFGLMDKVVCDRGSGPAGWRWTDHTGFRPGAQGEVRGFHPRNLMLMKGMMLFMNGIWNWHLWDAPYTDVNFDGYNGVFGALNYIFRKINISGQEVSLASLRPNLKFQKWKTEVSYDGGTTWQTHTGIDIRENPNRLPVRIAYTNSGYIAVFACRPFRVEPTSCKWRVTIGGNTYTGDITASDWQSCYPVEDSTRKDFYLTLIKAF